MACSHKFVSVSAAILLGAFLGSACTTEAEPAKGAPDKSAGPAPEYIPTATIKDIMLSIVDPSADVVWGAVQSVVTTKGIEDKVPVTDEDWEEARLGALRLVEATNLLLMPGRHVARPGEKSLAPGVELEPEEMEALINKDREGWHKRVRALHDAVEKTLRAIEKRDAETVFDLGETIEHACESCHLQVPGTRTRYCRPDTIAHETSARRRARRGNRCHRRRLARPRRSLFGRLRNHQRASQDRG